jgi:CheY-like chemotaxis protein
MRRALVVDDDGGIRRALCELLADEGYECATAADGIEALRLTGAASFALILLDLRMPQMDGRAFVAEYRRRPGPHAPIVVTSTMPDPDLEGVLPKPFDLDDVLALVERHTSAG